MDAETVEMTQGFYWHVHHTVLIEWCHGYKERAKYIREEKLENERSLRLRLFKPVKGMLPQEVLEARRAIDEAVRAYTEAGQVRINVGQAYDEAGRTFNEAYRAYTDAWEAYTEAGQVRINSEQVYTEAGQTYNEAIQARNDAIQIRDEARQAYDEARQAYDAARRAYYDEARRAPLNVVLITHKDAIEALHAQECTDCPWDGKTIFPAA